MNQIVRPITADGNTGYDQYNQLIAWTEEADGYRTGRMIKDVRACKCYICGKGWGNTTKELLDQVALDGRDMHNSCYDGWRALNSYYDIQKAVMDAGFLFRMDEVPPRYPRSTPWQRITVLHADKDRSDSGFRIVLGRRKRVWELRLHGTADLTDKFDKPNNTKGYSECSDEDAEFGGYFYIHAWDKKELVEFLRIFRHSIGERTSTSIKREDA